MQHLEVRGAVRPLKWSLGVKWLIISVESYFYIFKIFLRHGNQKHGVEN